MKLLIAVAINLLFCSMVSLDPLLSAQAQAQAQQRVVGQAPVQSDHGRTKVEPCSSASQSREGAPGQAQAGAQGASPPGDSHCLEMKGDAAELKKCLTSVLQEKGWSPLPAELPDHMSIWKRVDPQELRRIAVTQIAGGNVQWSEGRVDVTLALKSHNKGTTEVRVFANIMGRGNLPLPTMRPSDWWPLVSTGRVEDELLALVEASCDGRKRTPAAEAAGVRRF